MTNFFNVENHWRDKKKARASSNQIIHYEEKLAKYKVLPNPSLSFSLERLA